jgi:two-component system, chemotaxis family, sensor kinase CheA
VTAPDAEILEVFREEATERLDQMVETLLALESGHAHPDAIDSLFRDAHSIKGSAGMVGIEEIRTIAHSIEDDLEKARDSGSFSPELIEPMLKATDALRRAVAAGAGEAPEAPEAPEAAQATQAAKAAPPGSEHRSMRMSAVKVDDLFDAVGETVLHSGRLEALLDGDLANERDPEQVEEELAHGNALLDELQHSVIQMRTLPLSSITGSFARAVRDLAATQDKQVELEISGTETQLDRVILEGISESISHLLSNAVAHGIEPPAERESAGKPARGRVELRGYQRGSLVAIEVRDDGRGVAAEVQAGSDGDGTLADTLAQAGFSTAEEITEVSGRGVGLDAVKSHVESLGGGLEVESEPGQGTAVTMLLPLTLALLRVLLFERGGHSFGLPLTSVDEAITVRDTMSLAGREAIEVRGRSVPLADLADILGAAADELDPQANAMVVASSGRRVALLCDRIVEEQEVIIKSLGPLLGGVAGYLGAAIMHDSRIALILDPAFLTKKVARGRATVAVHTEVRPPTVLVVDDQFTVRELQRGILESAGYEVKTARDGREALASISSDPDIELVVTDVQMPEMDGIELLRAIRESRERSSLPFVMVTSKGGEEDRQRGLEAGADAYIVKDQFDQRTLIETVERLLAR